MGVEFPVAFLCLLLLLLDFTATLAGKAELASELDDNALRVAITLDERIHEQPDLVEADVDGGVGNPPMQALRLDLRALHRAGVAPQQLAVVGKRRVQFTSVEV